MSETPPGSSSPDADRPDAWALARAVAEGRRTAREVVAEALARAETLGRELNAFLVLDREGALARAEALDADPGCGGPLRGVPVALKANMCLEGIESSCASRILAGYRAPYTASFAARLLDAGAVPIGMTNMDEFAMGSSGENSAFGPTRNPWDPTRTPGGSSSGSAAAVAAGIVPLALGSDTGGSVRQPAALCGILGLKPTYGRISRYGLIAFGSSLDQVSPCARSVRDLELAMAVLAGPDERDSTTLTAPYTPSELALRGLRIGVPAEYFPADLDAGVRALVEQALARLERGGAELIEVRLPHTEYAIPTYYVVAMAEASSNLARYDGVRFGRRVEGDGSLQGMFAATRDGGFGEEVERRILLGTYVLSSGYHEAWYRRALKVRSLVARDFERAFEAVDLIAGPTSPTPAFPLGERARDPVAMYLSDTLTVPASLAGLPALSLPCGELERQGARLPVGLQLVGPASSDERILAAARAFEGRPGALVHPPPLVAQ